MRLRPAIGEHQVRNEPNYGFTGSTFNILTEVGIPGIGVKGNAMVIQKRTLSLTDTVPGAKALAQLAQQLQKVKTIGVVPEDFPAFVAAGSDVKTAPRTLDAQRACHKGI